MSSFATARRIRSPFVFLSSLLFVGVAACSETDPADPGGGGGPPPPQTTSITVRDGSFDPGAIGVAPGAAVTWTWAGNEAHDVVWASGNLPGAGSRTTGTHQVTMPSTAGEYVYYCSIHGTPAAGMRGTIVVDADYDVD